MFKKLKRFFGVGIPLVIVLLFLYAIAYAANRRSGANVTPGDGLFKNAAADSTDFHVRTGWGIKTDNDSVEANATALFDSLMSLTTAQTVTGAKSFSESLIVSDASGMLLGADGQDGKLTIFSEQGGTDYKIVFNPHATMTQHTEYTYPANDGDASQFLQTNGSGALLWATPSGSGDMLKSTYDVDEDGDIDQAAGGLETDVSAYTGLIGLNSGAVSEVDLKSELEGMLTDVSGLCETGDVETITADWVNTANPWADNEVADDITATNYLLLAGGTMSGELDMGDQDIVNAERIDGDTIVVNADLIADFTGAGMSVTAGALGVDVTASFTWTTGTHNFTGATITDASFEEADIGWNSTPILGEHTTSMWGNSDSVDIFLDENDVLHTYTRFENFSTQAGEICTVQTRYVATGDIDSVLHGVCTELTNVDSSGVAIVILKQSKVGGDTTRVYPTTGDYVLEASSTVDVYLRKLITGGSINAVSSGDILLIWRIGKVNADRYAKGELPVIYCSGK